MKKVIISILLILIIGLAGFFVWQKFFQKGLFKTSIKSMKVGAEIEQKGAGGIVSLKGGNVKLESQEKNFELSLPEKSVLQSMPVQLRNINSIDGLVNGWELLGGVEISPSGTQLDKEGELVISTSQSLEGKNLVAFAFDEDGNNFHFEPIKKVDGQKVILPIGNFSGHGVINVGDSTFTPPDPIDTQAKAKQYIANILREAQKSQAPGTEGLSDDTLQKIKNILTVWYKISIKPNLTKAQTNDDILEKAGKEFLSWKQSLQAFGLDKDFQAEINASYNSLAIGIQNAAEKASKKCLNDKDPSQAAKLMWLRAITQALGLDGKGGLSEKELDKKVKACANFELKITSHFNWVPSGLILDATGMIPLAMGDGFTLTGQGKLTINNVDWTGLKNCRIENGEESYNLVVPATKLTADKGGQKISLVLDIGEDFDNNYICDMVAGETVGTLTDGDNWGGEFVSTHYNDAVVWGGNEFFLNDWDIIGKGGTFAKKVYNQTSGQFHLHEDSTFELIHKPKN